MKKFYLSFLVIAVLFILAIAVAAQGVAVDNAPQQEEVYVLLQPGESAAVICENFATPDVYFLRAGGARVICPEDVAGLTGSK
jgi:hypothetical protein